MAARLGAEQALTRDIPQAKACDIVACARDQRAHETRDAASHRLENRGRMDLPAARRFDFHANNDNKSAWPI
jgi:hypothetical protein